MEIIGSSDFNGGFVSPGHQREVDEATARLSRETGITFVLVNHTEILVTLVGLADVRVPAYERRGPEVTLVIEQAPGVVFCPSCQSRAHIKEGPVVIYVDLSA